MEYWIANLAGFIGVLILLRIITLTTDSQCIHIYGFSVSWGANILISQFALNGLVRPELSTLTVLFAAWWAFLLGSLFVLAKQRSATYTVIGMNRFMATSMLVLLVILHGSAVIYESSFYQLSGFANLGELIAMYPSLRLQHILSDIDLPWFLEVWRWGHVWYLPLAMLMHSKRIISRNVLCIIFGFACLASLMKFTRAPLVQLVTITTVSWLILYKPKRSGKLFVVGSLGSMVILVFVAMQAILLSLDQFAQVDLSESILSYLGGSPKAYELLLHGAFPRIGSGFYSLDAVNYVFYKLQLIQSYPGLARPFVFIPIPTNIYTFLDAFTLDFGIIGALLGSFFTGVLVSWFDRRARSRPNLTNVVIYAYLVYACIMAPANNEFIRFGILLCAGLAWLCNSLIDIRLALANSADGFPSLPPSAGWEPKRPSCVATGQK